MTKHKHVDNDPDKIYQKFQKAIDTVIELAEQDYQLDMIEGMQKQYNELNNPGILDKYKEQKELLESYIKKANELNSIPKLSLEQTVGFYQLYKKFSDVKKRVLERYNK